MQDPGLNFIPPPSSPTISSISSSDLDTESTGSFFPDRSTTLGTLMGVNFPAVTFPVPSQRRGAELINAGTESVTKLRKRAPSTAFFGLDRRRRRRRWWNLCGDGEARPASLADFLEVERRFGDAAFYSAAAELEGVTGNNQSEAQGRNGRELFADGRVLPPADDASEGESTAPPLCRFPVSLTGICSGGVG